MIETTTFAEQMGTGFYTFLLGMGLVFCILIFLIGVISLMGRLVRGSVKKKPIEASQPAKPIVTSPLVSEPVSEEDDDDEIIAVITAAVAMMAQQEGKQYRITSFRRAGSSSSAWSQAGRQEVLYSKL